MTPVFLDCPYKKVRPRVPPEYIMPINLEEWEAEYKAGVQRKGTKWQNKFLAATGILEKARSEEAETRYATGTANAAANKLRQKALQAVTEEDLKGPVRTGGASLYSGPAQAKAPKARRRFARFAAIIDTQVAGLPAKTDDGEVNVDNRLKPIVRALQAAKRAGGV